MDCAVIVEPNHHVFRGDRTLVGTAYELTQPMLQSPAVFRTTMEELVKHDKSEELTAFSLEVTILPDADLYLHQFEADELHRLVSVEIYGPFKQVAQPFAMEIREFGTQRFAYAREEIMGVNHLVVASLDHSDEVVGLITKMQEVTGRPAATEATMYRNTPAIGPE